MKGRRAVATLLVFCVLVTLTSAFSVTIAGARAARCGAVCPADHVVGNAVDQYAV
jgi:hypothetical protein